MKLQIFIFYRKQEKFIEIIQDSKVDIDKLISIKYSFAR